MSKRIVVAALALAGVVGVMSPISIFAQIADASPAACIKRANDWRNAQVAPPLAAYRAATDANRAELQTKYVDAANSSAVAAQKMASDCSTKFVIASVAPEQLMDLINLYTMAKDTSSARRTSERMMTDPNLPARAKAQSLLLSMKQAVAAQSNFFGILDEAERIAAKIDALPDSLNDIKLQAHQEMLGRYEYLDVAAGLEKHALAMIALGRTTKTPNNMMAGYGSLARSFADRLHPDSALRILDAGEKELGAMAAQRFADFRHRYELIGKRAPAIEAAWWINTDAAKVVTPAEGKVTLIEFTAHWCGPCKNSYPGLRSLTERLKGKAFTGVMVTQLYGYLGTQKNLNEAQEIAADKEYFGKEHAVPFPVAINAQIKQTGNAFVQPKPDTDYRVGGIPQIMIVDKHGIIRQIVTGWDQGNTERFSKFIDQLLAEK
ncbi:MAG: TlpA disulfide reductase family protein [Gemmatimonadaceae bacterium]